MVGDEFDSEDGISVNKGIKYGVDIKMCDTVY